MRDWRRQSKSWRLQNISYRRQSTDWKKPKPATAYRNARQEHEGLSKREQFLKKSFHKCGKYPLMIWKTSCGTGLRKRHFGAFRLSERPSKTPKGALTHHRKGGGTARFQRQTLRPCRERRQSRKRNYRYSRIAGDHSRKALLPMQNEHRSFSRLFAKTCHRQLLASMSCRSFSF